MHIRSLIMALTTVGHKEARAPTTRSPHFGKYKLCSTHSTISHQAGMQLHRVRITQRVSNASVQSEHCWNVSDSPTVLSKKASLSDCHGVALSNTSRVYTYMATQQCTPGLKLSMRWAQRLAVAPLPGCRTPTLPVPSRQVPDGRQCRSWQEKSLRVASTTEQRGCATPLILAPYTRYAFISIPRSIHIGFSTQEADMRHKSCPD